MRYTVLILTVFIVTNLYSQTIITYDENNSPIDGTLKNVMIDSIGNVWAGVHQFNGTTWTSIGTAGEQLSTSIRIAYEDSKRVIWFGSSKGISKFNGSSWDYLTIENGLPDNDVRSIKEDNNGVIWIGTDKGGVVKIEDDSITVYNEANGFPSNKISSIAIDKNNNIWFGTYSGVDGCGLIKLNDEGWTAYNMDDGLAFSYVNDLDIDSKGNVWIGTDYAGVSKFDGTSFTTYTVADGLTSDGVYAVAVDQNDNIWFGTHSLSSSKNICKFDGSNWTKYPINSSVDDIAIDKNGNIWVAGGKSGKRYLYMIDFTPTYVKNNYQDEFIYKYDKIQEVIFVEMNNIQYIKIYDLHGKELNNERSNRISTSNLTNGIYILKATDKYDNNCTVKFFK
jgi:ligand-binding sensor domain-containing protein